MQIYISYKHYCVTVYRFAIGIFQGYVVHRNLINVMYDSKRLVGLMYVNMQPLFRANDFFIAKPLLIAYLYGFNNADMQKIHTWLIGIRIDIIYDS